jgi:hypothetical protein
MSDPNASPTATIKPPRIVVGTMPCPACGAAMNLTAGMKGRVIGYCSAPSDTLGKNGMPGKCGTNVVLSERQSRKYLNPALPPVPKKETPVVPPAPAPKPAPERKPAVARKPEPERKPEPAKPAAKYWFD